MDGRNTTAYPVALVDRDARAWRSGDLDVLLASQPDAALVENGGPIDRALKRRRGWRPAFVDPIGTVWVRQGVTLAASAPKARDQFP